jgi:hypothetical protein
MKWMSYKEASELVCSLGIQTIGELKAFCKSDSRPRNFPRAPGARIWWKKDEWRGLPAFLGRVRIHGWKIEKRKREWMFGLARDWLKGGKTLEEINAELMRGYEKAREIARGLNIGQTGYIKMSVAKMLPEGLPGYPETYFKRRGVWKGWYDYLGKGRDGWGVSDFGEARAAAREFCIQHVIICMGDYRLKVRECRKAGQDTHLLVFDPRKKFKRDGWAGVDDWIGMDMIVPKLVEQVKSLGIIYDREWDEKVGRGQVEARIHHSLNWYKKYGYEGKKLFGEQWTGRLKPKVVMLSYGEALQMAQEFARRNRIDSPGEWVKADNRPVGLPKEPFQHYRDSGWESWKVWLGFARVDLNRVDTSKVIVMGVAARDKPVQDIVEKWSLVSFLPGYENCYGYAISTYGRLLETKTNKLLEPLLVGGNVGGNVRKQHLGKNLHGRKGVSLIHRLVALAFIPNLDNKPMVNHIDGDPHNNEVWNLEWVTARENNYHAILSGSKKSALSVDTVAKVKVLLSQGCLISEIARAIGIDTGSVRNINYGKTYKWVEVGRYQYPIQGKTRKFHMSQEDQEKIKEMSLQETSMREIAKMMGVCKQTVYEVIHFGNRSREAVPMVNLSAMNVRIISEYNKPVDVVN